MGYCVEPIGVAPYCGSVWRVIAALSVLCASRFQPPATFSLWSQKFEGYVLRAQSTQTWGAFCIVPCILSVAERQSEEIFR